MDNLMSGLIGAIIGSIVGGLLSSWLGWLVYKKQVKSNLKLQKCDEILNSSFKINKLLDDLSEEVGSLSNRDLLQTTNNKVLEEKMDEVIKHVISISDVISIYGNILHISEIESNKIYRNSVMLQVVISSSDVSKEKDELEVYKYIDVLQTHLTKFSKVVKLNSHEQLYGLSDNFYMLKTLFFEKLKTKSIK